MHIYRGIRFDRSFCSSLFFRHFSPIEWFSKVHFFLTTKQYPVFVLSHFFCCEFLPTVGFCSCFSEIERWNSVHLKTNSERYAGLCLTHSGERRIKKQFSFHLALFHVCQFNKFRFITDAILITEPTELDAETVRFLQNQRQFSAVGKCNHSIRPIRFSDEFLPVITLNGLFKRAKTESKPPGRKHIGRRQWNMRRFTVFFVIDWNTNRKHIFLWSMDKKKHSLISCAF